MPRNCRLVASIADRARPDRRDRRGVRAPAVRRSPPRSARHPPGDARAHADHLVGRQDVQHHRLEDRLDERPRAARHGGPHGEAVPHLRQRSPVPAGDRRRSRAADSVLRRPRRRRCRRRAIASSRCWSTWGSPCTCRRRRISSRSTSVRSTQRATVSRSAGRSPNACGVVAIPNEVFYARPRVRPPHGALRVLQAVTGDRRGRPATVEGVRMTVLRVAAIQHDIVWHDRDANFARLEPMIDAAAAGGAGMILLTETFSTGFSFDTPGIGEAEGGPSSSFLGAAATRTARGSAGRARRSDRTRPPTMNDPPTCSCSPDPTAPCTATARSTPSPMPARSSSCAPAPSSSPSPSAGCG